MDAVDAPRSSRLIAAVIDHVLEYGAVLSVVPIATSYTYKEALVSANIPSDWMLAARLWLPLAFAILVISGQWGLLMWRQQTLGKLLLRIRIVAHDHRDLGFGTLVVSRVWLPAVIRFSPICIVAGLLSEFQFLNVGYHMVGVRAVILWLVTFVCLAADPLTIFRADRRCMHDRLAGTRVVMDRIA